jgi:hypothetical protein
MGCLKVARMVDNISGRKVVRSGEGKLRELNKLGKWVVAI